MIFQIQLISKGWFAETKGLHNNVSSKFQLEFVLTQLFNLISRPVFALLRLH